MLILLSLNISFTSIYIYSFQCHCQFHCNGQKMVYKLVIMIMLTQKRILSIFNYPRPKLVYSQDQKLFLSLKSNFMQFCLSQQTLFFREMIFHCCGPVTVDELSQYCNSFCQEMKCWLGTKQEKEKKQTSQSLAMMLCQQHKWAEI